MGRPAVITRARIRARQHSRALALSALPMPAGSIELEGTGHMTPLERPAELAESIMQVALQEPAVSDAVAAG